MCLYEVSRMNINFNHYFHDCFCLHRIVHVSVGRGGEVSATTNQDAISPRKAQAPRWAQSKLDAITPKNPARRSPTSPLGLPVPIPIYTRIMAAVPSSLFRWVVPAIVTASVAQSSMYDVKGGTRAVIFDRLSGVKESVVNEGTHFLIPWLQRAIVFDVRTRPRNISTTTGSKDLQMVTLTLRVLHRPEVKQLPKIYQVCFLIYPVMNIMADEQYRTSASTTMSVSSHPSVTRSSKPSSRNSTQQSSLLSVKPSATASGPIFSSAQTSSISLWKMSPSRT